MIRCLHCLKHFWVLCHLNCLLQYFQRVIGWKSPEMLEWLMISWATPICDEENLIIFKKENISHKQNYFKSFPGSAFRRLVWTESLKVTPPSPSSLKDPEAISTESLSTENNGFPCGSFIRNFLVNTSNLSWPRKIWFSRSPSASLALNVMFLDDSFKKLKLIKNYYFIMKKVFLTESYRKPVSWSNVWRLQLIKYNCLSF